MRQHVRAGDVDVVGFGEAGTERDVASYVLDVEGGSWNDDQIWATKFEGTALQGLTRIVDKRVDMAWTCLDLLKGFADRFVAGQVDLYDFEAVGRVWTFLLEIINSYISFVQGSTADEDVIWFGGFEQSLDNLVPNAVVASSDKGNSSRHRRH